MNKQLRVCICTTPIRPTPTTFPPMGSMAIIQSLEKIGVTSTFYNIDYFRPSHQEVEEFFKQNIFDIVGISAVVSTAYEYTKWLSKIIRDASPKTKIIVGGNLAASAEIILRKTAIDFCVVGDGEFIIQSLVEKLAKNLSIVSYDSFFDIQGICFLNKNGSFTFTGYGQRPDKIQIEYPDYKILEKDGSISHFFPGSEVWSAHIDSSNNHSKIIPTLKKIATVQAAKGCVARCTFCHRWEKGYRVKNVDEVIAHVQLLVQDYNIDAINISDENFGSDREITRDLAIAFGKLDMPWIVGGVRAKTVTKEDLDLWAQNGCLIAYFGIESGSQKMLDIMEKNVTVQENIDALRWTGEAGIATIIQLVIGMPGESDQTIQETIEFLKQVSPYILDWQKEGASIEMISINYAQALPGTPLYEYMRETGKIGMSLDEEESYLRKISDVDAYSEDHFINCTSSPMLKVLMWRWIILAELEAYHYQIKTNRKVISITDIFVYYSAIIFGIIQRRLIRNKSWVAKDLTVGGYFNIRKTPKLSLLLLNPYIRPFFYLFLATFVLFYRDKPISKGIPMLLEYLLWVIGNKIGRTINDPEISLRKILKSTANSSGSNSNSTMSIIRLGR